MQSSYLHAMLQLFKQLPMLDLYLLSLIPNPSISCIWMCRHIHWRSQRGFCLDLYIISISFLDLITLSLYIIIQYLNFDIISNNLMMFKTCKLKRKWRNESQKLLKYSIFFFLKRSFITWNIICIIRSYTRLR